MPAGSLSTKFVGAALSIALCASPVTAAVSAAPIQPVSPLIAVSVFGTQASAQAVCTNMASSAVAAGAAAAAQGQTGCVLPAVDTAVPPPPVTEGPGVPLAPTGDFGINWLLAGLGGLVLLGAILAATSDDDDEGRVIEISPS
jgi:hypothetical protein